MTSVLNVDTIAAKDGTSPVGLTKQYAAKAWANTNQVGTQSNRDSFNIASLTDGGTGSTTLGFTNNMNNANYSAIAERGTTTTSAYEISLPYNTLANTTSQYAWLGFSVSYASNQDIPVISTGILGDLA